MTLVRNYYIIFIFAGLSSAFVTVQAQTTTKPSFRMSGEEARALTLYAEDLSKMKHVTVDLKEHDGKMKAYTGAAMQEILALAGITMNKESQRKNLRRYLLVKCADGYQILFSLAELDSSFTDQAIILAYETEGKPLAANLGPFRVVVPGEKKMARSAYQVTELVVGSVKE